MDLMPPPETRPAEHLLRAHLAHAAHHEELADGQAVKLGEAINRVAGEPPPPEAPRKTPRRRRTK